MSAKHETARLEAFSDGIIAIAATLPILEVKVPHADEIHSAAELQAALHHLAHRTINPRNQAGARAPDAVAGGR